MTPARSQSQPPRPKPTPTPDDAWQLLSQALARFMKKYQLTQSWVADKIGISQPQMSYLLGNTRRERTRELLPSEAAAIELAVRSELDPKIVLGEIFRDAGFVEDARHPADAVSAYPFLDPDVRDDIRNLIERAEARYLAKNDLQPDESPIPRLVRSRPPKDDVRSDREAAVSAEPQQRRRRG